MDNIFSNQNVKNILFNIPGLIKIIGITKADSSCLTQLQAVLAYLEDSPLFLFMLSLK
jgi:hypothetical protein